MMHSRKRDRKIEKEKERGGRQRRERLKRGARRLWQSVKWCARLAAFPVRRSSLNEIGGPAPRLCDNGLRDVTTCVAFTRPLLPPLVATYAIGYRRMGLPLSRPPLYNKQIKQRTIIDPPSSSWVSWALEHPPVILVAREPLTRNHDTYDTSRAGGVDCGLFDSR